MPSLAFTLVVLGTQVIALVLSVYGAFGADATNIGSIGWPRGLIIIAISLGTFMVIDLLKVLTIFVWDKFADKSKSEFVKTPAFMVKNKEPSKAAKFIQKQKQQTFRFGYDRTSRRDSASSVRSY